MAEARTSIFLFQRFYIIYLIYLPTLFIFCIVNFPFFLMVFFISIIIIIIIIIYLLLLRVRSPIR